MCMCSIYWYTCSLSFTCFRTASPSDCTENSNKNGMLANGGGDGDENASASSSDEEYRSSSESPVPSSR